MEACAIFFHLLQEEQIRELTSKAERTGAFGVAEVNCLK